jgi:hypothetical protein
MSVVVVLTKGLMLLSEKAMLSVSPPATVKAWVVSEQLEPLPFVVLLQLMLVAAELW